jgi:CRP-like cAMP-binding protein
MRLPKNQLQRVLTHCEHVELTLGATLCGPGEIIRYVYFPIGSFISLMTPIAGHGSLEIALVGDEGMYGAPLVLGMEVASWYGVVQGAGTAWRMEADKFRKALKHNDALQHELNCYIHVLTLQLAQMAACNRYHLVEQRLARWLLMMQDRAHSAAFHMTHEFLANMLGVRRVGVTKAAGSLQRNHLISYSRGNVRINDVVGLEAASCDCYRADKESYDRVMREAVVD